MRRAAFLMVMMMLCTLEGAMAAEDFYSGKTIKIIEGSSPGSGTDTYTRAIQQHIGKHIPANPTLIIQHMPAGGGMAATNHVYNIAAKDGTELGLFNRNTLVRQILGEKSAKFDPAGFSWIGTPANYSTVPWVFMVSSRLPYKTVQDLQNLSKPLNVSGVGSTNPFPPILRDILNIKMNFIIGYTGPQAMLAVDQGEADAYGTGYGTVAAIKPDWTNGGKVTFVVQFGNEQRSSILPNVPTGREFVKAPDDLALIELAESGLKLGWPFAAPPGTPRDRVATLRTAFRALMADKEFRTILDRSKLEISPTYGEEYEKFVLALTKTPKSVLMRYKTLFKKR